MKRIQILFGGLVAFGLAACQPSASPDAKPAPAVVAPKPIVNDWQVEATQADVRAAVASIGTDKQMSAAEADASLVLPDWGVWSDMSEAQARALYQKIPFELGLKYVYGSGKNELVVFTDPHNQNDRRLLGLLRANARSLDATIYIFPLPSAPPVSNVSRILCARDPQKAWQDWADKIAAPKEELGSLFTSRIPEEKEKEQWRQWEQRNPDSLGCNGADRAAKIDALASELGVVFTPTLVFAHGRAWPGQFPEISDVRDTWQYVHGKLGISKH